MAKKTPVAIGAKQRVELFRNYVHALPSHHRMLALPFKGEKREFDVIRVPVDELRFNVDVGRLIVDRLTILKIDPRGDPDDPDVQSKLEERILALDETPKLMAQIKEVGQLEPGLITADGTVINGNRRLAVLRRLYKETKKSKFTHMDVAILPVGTGKKDLFLLEAYLQMTPDSRVRYGPVTTALEIRRGIEDYKVSKGEVAQTMSLSVPDVDSYLQRLQFMDEYLAFIGKDGDYALLEGAEGQGKNEHFKEVQTLSKRHGRERYWEAFLRQVFLLIRAGLSYTDIRKIKGWKTEGIGTYASSVNDLMPAAAPKGASKLARLARARGAGRSTGAIHLQRVANATKPAMDAARAAFVRTTEQLDNLDASATPERLLDQAVRKVRAIDLKKAATYAKKENKKLAVPRLLKLLDELRAQGNELRSQLGKIKSP